MTDSDFLHQVELHLSLASKIKEYEPITAKLDGSIKKNTSFIKKLKQGITAQQLPSLLQELSALKVDKYLEEICSSITDFTYKTTSDIWAAVELSSVLYCRYEEFRVMLCTSLLKAYGQLLKSNTENAKDEQMRLGKIKSNLKFLTELYMVGMIMEDKSKNLVPNLLKFLLVGDKELKHCHVAFAFSKAYSMYLLPNNICSQQGIEFMKIEKRDALLNAGQREKCYVLLSDYFEKVKEALLKEHLKLQNLQISNEANFIARGEINQDKVDQLTIREKQLEKSKFGAQSMATSLFLEMCEFPQQEKQIEFTIGIAENLPRDGIDGDSIWEDLESKTFYENVIDLSNLVPAVLLGKKQTKVVEEVKIEFDEGKAIENVDEPVSEMEGDGVSVEVEQEDSPEISGTKAQMEEIMTQLNSSLSKEAVDQIAVKFAFINNKGTRKRLAQALLAVPRQRLDLLPHYARLLATLDPYMPSLTLLVTKELESSFRYHQRKKDQLFFEEKIKNIKFIAELCKFQIISHVSVFYCLKVLLDKFAFHNIEILCAMLETCGRFLYFKPETQLIMAKFVSFCNYSWIYW